MTFWMKTNANPVDLFPLVIKSNSGWVKTWNYGVWYGYGSEQSIWAGFGDGTNFKAWKTSVSSISLNNWQNIAVIISPPSISVYINGVSQTVTDGLGGTATLYLFSSGTIPA